MRGVQLEIPQHIFPLRAILHHADVPGGAPQLRLALRPRPRLLAAPGAEVEQHGPAGRPNGSGHPLINCAPRHAFGMIAEIHLHQVHPPRRKGARVLLLVLIAALVKWIGEARMRADVRVDSGLQSARMKVIDQVLHPMRKARRIHDECSIGSARRRDAFLNQHVTIAQIAHAGRDQRVALIADGLVIVVAKKVIPARPAHRRRRRQSNLRATRRRLSNGQAGRSSKDQKQCDCSQSLSYRGAAWTHAHRFPLPAT